MMPSSFPTKVSEVVRWRHNDGLTFDGWLTFEAYAAVVSFMAEAYVDLHTPTIGGFQEFAL